MKTNKGMAMMLKLPITSHMRSTIMEREPGPHKNSENSKPVLAVVQARGTPSASKRKKAPNISAVKSSGFIITS
jgi:hypothetical protein